jgi:isopentenyl diphosphate isomerase/L-lactate dehydrogenase-like FMN-dependent dehydrogenase
MLHLFHEEFKKAMQLMGCQSIKDITRDRLAILGSSGFLKRLDQLDWR